MLEKKKTDVLSIFFLSEVETGQRVYFIMLQWLMCYSVVSCEYTDFGQVLGRMFLTLLD